MNRRGGTLVEVLVALFLFVSILPALFSALGVGLLGVSKLRAADDRPTCRLNASFKRP